MAALKWKRSMKRENWGKNFDHCFNDVLYQHLNELQPPYMNSWSLFDDTVISMSKYYNDDNVYDQVFYQLHIMNRIAIDHRFKGRFKMALNMYHHIEQFADIRNLTINSINRFFVVLSSNITLLYRDWAENVRHNEAEYKRLMTKCVKQTYFTAKCIKIDKQKTKIQNENIYKAYLKQYDDDKFNINMYLASMHLELAYSKHCINSISCKIDKKQLKECEFHWNKAFEIYMAPNMEFTEATYYFIGRYIEWLQEIHNKTRSNRKLIYKLYERNLDFARKQFGELSVQMIKSYRSFAIFYGQFCVNYEKAIKYYQIAIDLYYKCLKEKIINNIEFYKNQDETLLFKIYQKVSQYHYELGQLHHLNGDLNAALISYQKCISNANISLTMNISIQYDLKKSVLKYQSLSEKEIIEIQNYSELDKEKSKCINCQKIRKKNRKIYQKKLVTKLEKSVQPTSEKKDITLKNMANLKQCAFCKTKSIKLMMCSKCRLVFYCSRKHQKIHWKYHKTECKQI